MRAFFSEDELQVNLQSGEMKKMLDERADMLKREKTGQLTAVESAYLSTVRGTGAGANVIAEKLDELNEATKLMHAEMAKSQYGGMAGVGVIKKDTSVVSKNQTADQAGVWLQYNGYGN